MTDRKLSVVGDRDLRCRLGIHQWTTVNGLDEQFPTYSDIECRRCDAEKDRLPHLWIDADGVHAQVGGQLIPPAFIGIGFALLAVVFYPILRALAGIVGAIV